MLFGGFWMELSKSFCISVEKCADRVIFPHSRVHQPCNFSLKTSIENYWTTHFVWLANTLAYGGCSGKKGHPLPPNPVFLASPHQFLIPANCVAPTGIWGFVTTLLCPKFWSFPSRRSTPTWISTGIARNCFHICWSGPPCREALLCIDEADHVCGIVCCRVVVVVPPALQ